MNKTKILKILADLNGEIRQKYKAQIKGIFGSYARGEQKDTSDIDILVDFEDDADLFDFTGLALFLEEKLNLHVDIVPEKSLRKEIKRSVLKEVIRV
jgi:predicted nucleotidyltransferase